MANVHPSSVIDPSAVLADDVTIGPNCVLRGEISIASGCELIANVFLQGPLKIGVGNTFYPSSAIGMPPQDRSYDPKHPGAGTVIGDNNIFREGATIHRATREHPTTVGDNNYFMVNTHAGHDCIIHNDCTFANGALLAGHVEVFDRVTLGGNAVVHQFCRLGRLSMIAGNRGVTKDLPPFCICWDPRTVSMLNLVGLRRSGHRENIKAVRAAFELLFTKGHTTTAACDLIEQQFGDDPLCREMVEFVRTSQRGITPYSKKSDTGEITGDS